jgi:hypothetical protein
VEKDIQELFQNNSIGIFNEYEVTRLEDLEARKKKLLLDKEGE